MKFKIDDDVVLVISEEKLRSGSSKTQRYCGVNDEMIKATDMMKMKVVSTHSRKHPLHGDYISYKLRHPKFHKSNSWWFHEDDLDFYNSSLENE